MVDRADLIRLLEAELDVIEGGGYGRSVHDEPWKERPMFKNSIACIQHWNVPDHEPECHQDCVLMNFVPDSAKNEAMPCHFIPLNERGDTVHSLEAAGRRDKLEAVVADWLRKTIERLKSEQASQPEKPTESEPVIY